MKWKWTDRTDCVTFLANVVANKMSESVTAQHLGAAITINLATGMHTWITVLSNPDNKNVRIIPGALNTSLTISRLGSDPNVLLMTSEYSLNLRPGNSHVNCQSMHSRQYLLNIAIYNVDTQSATKAKSEVQVVTEKDDGAVGLREGIYT